MLDTIKEMADAEAKKQITKRTSRARRSDEGVYDFLGELQDELSEIDFIKIK